MIIYCKSEKKTYAFWSLYVSDKLTNELHIYSTARIAEVEVTATAENCRHLGGAIRNPDVKPEDKTFCQFEMCVQDSSKCYTWAC